MRARSLLAVSVGAAAITAVPAAAQQYIPAESPVVFHLHRGSTFQAGCWGACACALSDPEPLRGTFRLELVNIGNATDFYQISQIDWRIRSLFGQQFNRVIAGSGPFAAGQAPFADHQFMNLDLTISPSPSPWEGTGVFSGDGLRSVDPPVIDILVANSATGCPGVRMRLVATWFQSDWDASGRVGPEDLFEFLSDYFRAQADYTMDGSTSVQDLFAFLTDWFAGT